MILWNDTICSPLEVFHRNVLISLTQDKMILTTFQSQLLNHMHIRQKSSSTHWKIKLWKDKKYSCFTSLFWNELLFPTGQLTAFLPEKYCPQNAITSFQANSYAQVTSSAKVYGNTSEAEKVNVHCTENRKLFDLIKQIEEINEQYRANSSELSDIESLKKILMDITLHNSPLQICKQFWKQGNNFLANWNLLSQYWNKILMITSFQNFDTEIFALLETSYIGKLLISL